MNYDIGQVRRGRRFRGRRTPAPIPSPRPGPAPYPVERRIEPTASMMPIPPLRQAVTIVPEAFGALKMVTKIPLHWAVSPATTAARTSIVRTIIPETLPAVATGVRRILPGHFQSLVSRIFHLNGLAEPRREDGLGLGTKIGLGQPETILVIVRDAEGNAFPGVQVAMEAAGGIVRGVSGSDGIARLAPPSPMGPTVVLWADRWQTDTEVSYPAAMVLGGEPLFLDVPSVYAPEVPEADGKEAIITVGILGALALGAVLLG